MKKLKKSHVFLGVCLVVFALLPTVTQNKFLISMFVYTFLFASFGVAWNIIGGYGAQISWCHASFAACGAYTAFLFYFYLGISPFLTMPIGMAIAFVLSTLIGRGTFKLRGTFFSLSTIAFSEICKICLLHFKEFTRGSSGVWINYDKDSFWKMSFSTDIPFYYIALILLIIVMIVTVIFQNTKTGYYLGAIKGDEDAANTLGIESFNVKLRAFQVSAMMTSVIGTVYACFLTYIDPYSTCSLDLSIKIGMNAIVGGVGTLWGPVLGSFLIQPLTQITNTLFANISGASMLMYALILILVVLFRPEGLITLFVDKDGKGLLNRLGRHKKNQGEEAVKGESGS